MHSEAEAAQYLQQVLCCKTLIELREDLKNKELVLVNVHACVCVCGGFVHVSVNGGQKRASDALELELWGIVSHPTGAGS